MERHSPWIIPGQIPTGKPHLDLDTWIVPGQILTGKPHLDLDTWIVPGEILTGKPPAGTGKQLQTSWYRGVDLSRAEDILKIHSRLQGQGGGGAVLYDIVRYGTVRYGTVV